MRVLFVCTGNTCRSPMAELYLSARLKAAGRSDIAAASAGIAAFAGEPMSLSAQTVMARCGLDGSSFRSSRCTAEMVKESDLVIAMSRHHREALVRMMPEAEDKIKQLADYGNGKDVPDPFGGSVSHYLDIFGLMRPALDHLAETLINNQ